MKTAGIIGGIGPEATIDYYRSIIASYREREHSGSYPSIIVNSINLQKLLDLMTADELPAATDFLIAEVNRLDRAGVDFGAFASNSPHLVFDEIRARSPIPLLSIVEAARDAASDLGMKRVGLLGTRFTMKGGFYQKTFASAGMTVLVPEDDEQTYIHEKYIGELLNNMFLPETRDRLLAIVDGLKDREGIEGLILGGTELPLILRDPEHNGIRFLDTTQIHVKRIVAELLS